MCRSLFYSKSVWITSIIIQHTQTNHILNKYVQDVWGPFTIKETLVS